MFDLLPFAFVCSCMYVNVMLFPTVPDSTDDCSSTPTYDQATGLLQSIAVSWNEIAVSST